MRKILLVMSVLVVCVFFTPLRPAICQLDDNFYLFRGQQVKIKTISHFLSIVFNTKPNEKQRIYIQEVIPNKADIVVSQLLTLEKLWLLHVTQGKSASISYYINMVESIPVVEFVFAAKTTPLKDILFLSDEIIVRYKEGVRESRIQEIIGWTGVKDLKIKDTENLYRLFLSKKSKYRNPILLANLLAKEYKEISFASPNFYRTVTLFKTPDDPFYPKQWGLKNVQAPSGWDKSTGDDSIKIAVIDDGVDTRHPDLNYSQGYNALTDQMGQKPNSWDCHGTAVSGLASGVGNNAKGLSGIIWRSKIVPIRVFYTKKDGPAKTITSDDIMARGIRKAYQIGSDILIIAWGCSVSDPIRDAIDEAYEKGRKGLGCLIAAASGNDPYCPKDGVRFPASNKNVIAVGAVDRNGKRWAYSCFGKKLSVVAPSGQIPQGDIFTTDQVKKDGFVAGDYYEKFGGTSAAVPLVGGLAGLILTCDKNVKAKQIRSIIEETADDLGSKGRDDEYGYGLINVYKAINRINN